jgi:hypothetical protein
VSPKSKYNLSIKRPDDDGFCGGKEEGMDEEKLTLKRWEGGGEKKRKGKVNGIKTAGEKRKIALFEHERGFYFYFLCVSV